MGLDWSSGKVPADFDQEDSPSAIEASSTGAQISLDGVVSLIDAAKDARIALTSMAALRAEAGVALGDANEKQATASE